MALPSPAPPLSAVILLAGGSGARAALGIPKQAAFILGKPALLWSFETFAAMPQIGTIVLVGDEISQALVGDQAKVRRAPGGVSRRASVASGLAVLEDLPPETMVLVHDSARPGVNVAVICRLFDALSQHDAAIPSLPIADTLVTDEGGLSGPIVDRSALARVQTPQAFRLGTLRCAHALWSGDEPTDDAQMVRAARTPVALVAGDAALHKLTWASDIPVIEAQLAQRVAVMTEMRTAVGQGYDVHRLVAAKPLWICGVNIPHSHGLSGHSDADVALHALTDAILGALADADIGHHFPPSDHMWRGAASHRFVQFAAERVAARGGRIEHVDVTIIAEAPKIGPHRHEMRAAVAQMLGLKSEQVSVKATTTEGLGFAGRREGIAAMASATLSLPR